MRTCPVLRANVACSSDRACSDCREELDERAAILQFGQTMFDSRPPAATREEADAMAAEQLRARLRRGEQGALF